MPQLFSDRDIEQLLRGQQPPGRGDLAEVAGLVAQLRADAAHEQAPPINEHLRSVLEGRPTDIARAAEKRRLRSARRRWQVASVAAAVLLVGGLVAVIVGRSDDDLTTRPGDKVSVDESAEGNDPSTTGAPGSTDTTSGAVFAPDDDPTGIDRPGSGSSASSTVPSTETTPEDPGDSTTFGTDGGARNCAAGDDACWELVDAGRCASDGACTDVAEDVCDDGDRACWAGVWRDQHDDRSSPFSRDD
jgi:hypothetical protein